MQMFDPAKVDLVSLTPDGGTVRLYIVSESEWTGSDDQINSLQAKIHNYVGYAVDGPMAEAYPELRGLPWQIVIRCRAGSPDPRTDQVVGQLVGSVRQYGGDLIIEV